MNLCDACQHSLIRPLVTANVIRWISEIVSVSGSAWWIQLMLRGRNILKQFKNQILIDKSGKLNKHYWTHLGLLKSSSHEQFWHNILRYSDIFSHGFSPSKLSSYKRTYHCFLRAYIGHNKFVNKNYWNIGIFILFSAKMAHMTMTLLSC